MITQDHPLQYYFDFIENHLDKLKADFFHTEGMKYQYFLDYGQFATIEWIKDKSLYRVSIFESSSEPSDFELGLELFISQHLEYINKGIKKVVRSNVFNKGDEEVQIFISSIYKEIQILIDSTTKSNDELAMVIVDGLKSLSEFIISYKAGMLSPRKVSLVNSAKVKWLGNINTLGTLFYDLANGTTSLGAPLIEFDRIKLCDFIVNSFIDRDGNPLSKHTIYTILDPQKWDKKAKKAIEIGKYFSDVTEQTEKAVMAPKPKRVSAATATPKALFTKTKNKQV